MNAVSLNDKRVSDNIFEMLNWAHDAKLSGKTNKDEFSKIITLEGKLFSNLVKNGQKTEDDVESFETLIPIDFEKSKKEVQEQNTDALMQLESWYKQSSPVENFSKGLRRL